jgi:two-component system chemotaxis response regulator CheB
MEGKQMRNAKDREEPQPRVIAIGGSADGLMSLTTILQDLPSDFPAAVLITQHVRRGRKSLLPRLLARRCKLPVRDAAPGEPLRPAPHEAVR